MSIPATNTLRIPAIFAIALAALTCTSGALHADVAVLYADDFNGPSGADLNALPPDTRSGDFGSSATATWAAGEQFEADGTAWSNPNSRTSALLPFTPVAGQLYELTADIDGASSWVGQQDDWIALGFAENGNSADNFARTATHGYAWMTVSSLGGADQGFRYAGDAAHPTAGSATFATTTDVMSLRILLDTRDANWTVQWFLDGVQVTGTHTYTANPDINYVGFSRYDNARAYIDNFQLAVIPEPSSFLTLLTAGVGALLLSRRRRN